MENPILPKSSMLRTRRKTSAPRKFCKKAKKQGLNQSSVVIIDKEKDCYVWSNWKTGKKAIMENSKSGLVDGILGNKWLSDLHMTVVNKLLNKCGVNGLQETTLAPTQDGTCIVPCRFQPQPPPSVNIHHNGRNHWVTSFEDENNDIFLLDSDLPHITKNALTDSLILQLVAIYGQGKNKIIIKIPRIQQQRNSYDCGQFAIANALEFISHRFRGLKCGQVNFKFIQEDMRLHFLKGLIVSRLDPFPKLFSPKQNIEIHSFEIIICELCCKWSLRSQTFVIKPDSTKQPVCVNCLSILFSQMVLTCHKVTPDSQQHSHCFSNIFCHNHTDKWKYFITTKCPIQGTPQSCCPACIATKEYLSQDQYQQLAHINMLCSSAQVRHHAKQYKEVLNSYLLFLISLLRTRSLIMGKSFGLSHQPNCK